MIRYNFCKSSTQRLLLAASLCLAAAGCHCGHCRTGDPHGGPPYDRPFPLGAVTDVHWETQQTNAEAADFIFFDHEFVGETAELAPGAKRHLESVALRLRNVPFPIVIEQTLHDANRDLDRARRTTILESLALMGHSGVEQRVVIAPAFAEGLTAVEAESAYRSTLGGSFENGGGIGRRFGGRGGMFR